MRGLPKLGAAHPQGACLLSGRTILAALSLGIAVGRASRTALSRGVAAKAITTFAAAAARAVGAGSLGVTSTDWEVEKLGRRVGAEEGVSRVEPEERLVISLGGDHFAILGQNKGVFSNRLGQNRIGECKECDKSPKAVKARERTHG